MTSVEPIRNFPSGFLWGCATSPAQIEGETVSEWAGFLARDKTTPDDGPGHWQRIREDFSLLSSLKVNAYRLGFDWGRLQPGPNAQFDPEAARQYSGMLDLLHSLGIEPWITLFHFACPKWLAERGGWLCPEAPALFADFAQRMAALCAGRVRHWLTVNEPEVYAFMAYVMAEFPPRHRLRFDQCFSVMKNLHRGHALAYDAIHKADAQASVGIAKHFKRFLPLRWWHPMDQAGAWFAKRLFDEWGLSGFLQHGGRQVSDFVGVNYYGRMRMCNWGGMSPLTGFPPIILEQYGADCDDMWEQDPEHLASCLAEAGKRTSLPLYVTENGVATNDEELRLRFLREHLASLHQATQMGVDVRGFFYWSLMDNFEWGEGLAKRFGLIAVDYQDKDKKRSQRPAAEYFKAVAGSNELK